MTKIPLRIILADLRSCANVGSILRTAEAMGVELVYATGYTPYPTIPGDSRPPHIAHANSKAIAKTALGAETYLSVIHTNNVSEAISKARIDGFKIIMLEQAENSLNLATFRPQGPVALVLGSEVQGIAAATLSQADHILEIPMLGRKESFGVAVAAGIALYQLRHSTD